MEVFVFVVIGALVPCVLYISWAFESRINELEERIRRIEQGEVEQ